jgi:hypothetical protein
MKLSKTTLKRRRNLNHYVSFIREETDLRKYENYSFEKIIYDFKNGCIDSHKEIMKYNTEKQNEKNQEFYEHFPALTD